MWNWCWDTRKVDTSVVVNRGCALGRTAAGGVRAHAMALARTSDGREVNKMAAALKQQLL